VGHDVSIIRRQQGDSSAARRIPHLIGREGPDAAKRFKEFFAATIRNKNTRAAYARAIRQFFDWCEDRSFRTLDQIEPIVVAAYIEQHGGSKPTVKQHLAAIRMLFDWLVTGQVLPHNPATSVRGPKHVVKRGTTPVLDADQARELLDSIDIATLAGLRDRALIGVMVYSFARVSAAVAMRVQDYFPEGKRWWLRLHEKGGKLHSVPAHHNAEAYLDAYTQAAGTGPSLLKGRCMRLARSFTAPREQELCGFAKLCATEHTSAEPAFEHCTCGPRFFAVLFHVRRATHRFCESSASRLQSASLITSAVLASN